MVFLSGACDQAVIDITDDSRNALENGVHETWKYGSNGCHSKREPCVLIQALVCVNRDARHRSLIQLQLQVCLGEIQLGEQGPISQCREEIFLLGQGILIDGQSLVDGDFIVPTKTKMPILLGYSNGGCSPGTGVDFRNDPLFL